MRSRIFLAAALLAGGVAALAVGISTASGKAAASQPMQVSCSFTLTTEPPPGSDNVVPPQQQGHQDGPVYCKNAPSFKLGAIRTNFTIPDSGDTVGTFTQYFDTGTIGGHFELVPKNNGGFGQSGYAAQNYGGKFKIWYGTGAYKGIKGTQPGLMYCKSPDSVHLTCKETMTVKEPATAS